MDALEEKLGYTEEQAINKLYGGGLRVYLAQDDQIQDIVDDLGGLTKGALYHHFRSKEEIMVALSQRMFARHDPFAEVQARKDLNGLQKMRLAVRLNQSDAQQVELNRQAIPLIKNPRVLSQMLETNIKELCPRWQRLIEEGIADGSIHTAHAQELSQLLVLLDLWMIPSIFPGDSAAIRRRLSCMAKMLESLGLPLIDEALTDTMDHLPYFQETD